MLFAKELPNILGGLELTVAASLRATALTKFQ